jgi:sec-independent protein translocase protein TatC
MPLDQVTNEELDKKIKAEETGESEMSFLDHLESLRWHLIRGIIAIVVFMIAAFMNVDFIFKTVILGPAKKNFWTYQQMCKLSDWLQSNTFCLKTDLKLINTTLGGQFFMHITSSIVVGLICAFPYLFWEVWRFVKPGLYKKERQVTTGVVFYVTCLFLMGVSFGYFIVAPFSINFLYNYSVGVENFIALTNYVSLLVGIVLASGLLFQLPLVAFTFAKIGLLTSKLMKTYRRYAYIIILIISAIITPGGDMFTQILFAFPITILYEVSISVVKRVEKKRKLAEEML